MSEEKRIDFSEFVGVYTVAEATRVIEAMKQKIAEAQGLLPECGNKTPPCCPDIKFGGLVCSNCEWGE